jgi:hypothetical protein
LVDVMSRVRPAHDGVLSAEEHELARQQIQRLGVPPAVERPREEQGDGVVGSEQIMEEVLAAP